MCLVCSFYHRLLDGNSLGNFARFINSAQPSFLLIIGLGVNFYSECGIDDQYTFGWIQNVALLRDAVTVRCYGTLNFCYLDNFMRHEYKDLISLLIEFSRKKVGLLERSSTYNISIGTILLWIWFYKLLERFGSFINLWIE